MSVLAGITEQYWLVLLKYICIGAVPCEYVSSGTLRLLGVYFVRNCIPCVTHLSSFGNVR
jgi:hypothetical protein